MAIYHLSAKVISRSNGGSAVAAAAYRSADKLNNYTTNQTYNYKRKQSVDYTEIILPDNAPKEFYNREILWNSVEQNEKQKNAQLAREIEFALPKELNFEQQKRLARDFAKTFARQGMCVDLAFHDKKNNPHCHLLLTLRGLDKNGKWLPKCKKVNNRRVNLNNWNDKETLEKWRKDWEFFANGTLSSAGMKERIDHRSYKRQGVKKIPTIHLGKAANVMEKANQPTERGNINREIRQLNLFNEKIKPTLEQYADARKKIPSTDDPRNFRLWLLYAYRNVEKKEKQLKKDIDSGEELKQINSEKAKMQSLIDAENEKIKTQRLPFENFIKNEHKNLNDAKEKVALAKKERENAAALRDKTYKIVSETKNTDPSYSKKIEDYNQARENFSESIRALEKREKELVVAEENYNKKLAELPQIEQFEKTESSSNAKIGELNGQIKNLGNLTNFKLAELQKDKDFLQAIHKDFKIQFDKNPDPLWQKYKKDGESYPDFLVSNQKELKLNIKNCDTSASFVRQLRQAEQTVQDPSFLANLAKTLANTDAPTPIAVDCLSSGDAFNVPFNYDDSVSVSATVVDKNSVASKAATATPQSDNHSTLKEIPPEQAKNEQILAQIRKSLSGDKIIKKALSGHAVKADTGALQARISLLLKALDFISTAGKSVGNEDSVAAMLAASDKAKIEHAISILKSAVSSEESKAEAAKVFVRW